MQFGCSVCSLQLVAHRHHKKQHHARPVAAARAVVATNCAYYLIRLLLHKPDGAFANHDPFAHGDTSIRKLLAHELQLSLIICFS